jgi:hypothetical protein
MSERDELPAGLASADTEVIPERISRAGYEVLGGIEGALAVHADAVLKAQPAADRRLARSVLTSLVSDQRTRSAARMPALGRSGLSSAATSRNPLQSTPDRALGIWHPEPSIHSRVSRWSAIAFRIRCNACHFSSS